MPYRSTSDLPDSVRNVLPSHAQDIFMEAFNRAWEQYDQPQERRNGSSREKTAFRVAWSAVKNRYEKEEKSGKWVEK